MTQPRPIRVVIVDDHAEVRSGLEAVLMVQDDMLLVGQAGSGQEAIQVCSQTQPDVALMDLLMPDMNGVDVIRALRERCPNVSILVLSFTFPEDPMVKEVMQAGASGYLMKNGAQRPWRSAFARSRADVIGEREARSVKRSCMSATRAGRRAAGMAVRLEMLWRCKIFPETRLQCCETLTESQPAHKLLVVMWGTRLNWPGYTPDQPVA